MPVLTDLQRSVPAVSLGICLVAVWIAIRGRKALAVALLILITTMTADTLNAFVLKQGFARARPNVALPHVQQRSPGSGYSFPSNHATNCFAAASLFSAAYPELGALVFGAAILVAFSRVYVGVHYPLDVLASAFVGILLGRLFWWIGRRFVDREPLGWRRRERASA
jgi:membrane-associated phospholipid phosphatase